MNIAGLPSIEKWQPTIESFRALTRLTIYGRHEKWSNQYTITIFNISTLKHLRVPVSCFREDSVGVQIFSSFQLSILPVQYFMYENLFMTHES